MKTTRTVITRDPSTIYLFKLLDEIRSGALLIPYSIQRDDLDFERRNELLNNILMGLPVGALTILHQGQTSLKEIKAKTHIGSCQIAPKNLRPRRYIFGEISWLLSVFGTLQLDEHAPPESLVQWGTMLNLDSFKFEAWQPAGDVNTPSKISHLLPTMMLRSHRLLTRWVKDHPELSPTQIEHATEAASRFNAYKVTTIPVATDDPEAIEALVEQVSAKGLRTLPATTPVLFVEYTRGYRSNMGLGLTEQVAVRRAIELDGIGSRLTIGFHLDLTPEAIAERVRAEHPVLVHIALEHGSADSERMLDRIIELLCDFNLGVRVVILSGCFSRPLSERLCSAGLAVVGYDSEQTENDALDFLSALYTGLARGRSLAESFILAQGALASEAPSRRGAFKLRTPTTVRAEDIVPTDITNRPVEMALAPTGRGVRPHQVVLHLDAYDGGHSVSEVEALLDPHHKDRKVFRLSQHMQRLGVSRLVHGQELLDWDRLAEATQTFMDEALASRSEEDVPVDYIISGVAPHPTFAHVGYMLKSWRGRRQIVIHRDQRDGSVVQFTLGDGAATPGPHFFAPNVKKLGVGVCSPSDGTVGFYLGALGGPLPTPVEGYFKEHNIPVAEVVELIHGRPDEKNPGRVTPMSADDGPRVAMELILANTSLANSYPNHSGVTLFVNGPGFLAFLAGRALNPRQQPSRSITLTYYRHPRYMTAYTLPLSSSPKTHSPGK